MIDRTLTALYRRFGALYLDGALVAALFLILIFTALNTLAAVLVGRHSPQLGEIPLGRLLLIGQALMLVVAPGWGIYLRRRCKPMREWAAGQRDEASAQRAWDAATVEVPAYVGVVLAVIMAVTVPAAGGGVYSLTHDVVFAVAGVIAFLLMGVCAGVLVAVFAETYFAPVAREVATEMPQIPDGAGGLTISVKLLILPIVVAFYTALLASALTPDHLSGLATFVVIIGTVAGLTLTIGLMGTLLFRRSLVDPLNALTKATVAVGAGDLSVTVPPQTEDELGQLTQSFNNMVLNLKDLTNSLRASRARAVTTADAERRRMERDLHDGAQQNLVLLNLRLGQILRASEGNDQAVALATEARKDLQNALTELRDLAHGIYPASLENEGIPGALGDAARRSAIDTVIEADGVGRFSREIEAATYFCCLEALQNTAKYAGEGATARLSLLQEGDKLRFEIADDGPGFDTTVTPNGAGLANMADRIGALGGAIDVHSEPGAGTRVVGSVPVA